VAWRFIFFKAALFSRNFMRECFLKFFASPNVISRREGKVIVGRWAMRQATQASPRQAPVADRGSPIARRTTSRARGRREVALSGKCASGNRRCVLGRCFGDVRWPCKKSGRATRGLPRIADSFVWKFQRQGFAAGSPKIQRKVERAPNRMASRKRCGRST